MTEAMRAEADEIARTHPDILEPQTADVIPLHRRIPIRHSFATFAGDIPVSVDASSGLVRLRFGRAESHDDLLLDVPIAAKILAALVEVIEDCASCGQPGARGIDLRKCRVVGDWMHDACHDGNCSSLECVDGTTV